MTKIAADPFVCMGVLARRCRSAIEWRIYRPLHVRYAALRRSRLDGLTFIGVTGSAGKTSAKSMIAAILQCAGSVRQSSGSANRLYHLAEVVATTDPADDYCVLELSAERPGYFDQMINLVRPTIGVVTTIGDDRYKLFGSREAIALEKGKLIAALPPEGTAVLNADDPLVWAMRNRCKGHVISYGLSDEVDLKARDIRAAWPERLSFTVSYRGEDYPVRTQLCGKHWVISTLAALATGVAVGVPLRQAVEVVAQIPPYRARMEPVTMPNGITVLRDDWKAPMWAMSTVFEFFREAKAARKVLVLGTLTNYHGTVRSRYQEIGREAFSCADMVMFVGNAASRGLRAQKFVRKDQTLMVFPELREAAVALRELLRPGDLVLLKASGRADHLGRLYHALTGPVACWRLNCGKDMLCDVCPQLRSAGVGNGAAVADVKMAPDADSFPSEAVDVSLPTQVVIGIGNPGGKYRDTPHNVGFAVLDLLAERHGLAWESRGEAEIARLARPEGGILLVKPQKHVNNTGKVVLALSKSLGFTGDRCVLVHDDIHLPVGKVRTRLRGSDGGHLGIRSVLAAFQTGDIPRVKIGVGSATNTLPPARYLVSPFPPGIAKEVRAACAAAADRLSEMSERQLAER